MKAGYSCPLSHSLHIIIIRHWEVKVGGTSMKQVRGARFAGSSPPQGMADVVYYFIGERLKLEGETENRGV